MVKGDAVIDPAAASGLTPWITAAERRYQARVEERGESEQAISQRGILGADRPERVERRLGRLGTTYARATAVSEGAEAPPGMPPTGEDRIGLERLLGESNLIGAAFLAQGARAAASIGRVAIGRGGYGTGWLISDRLMITNNHVLEDAESAARSQIEFRYELGPAGEQLTPLHFRLEPELFFETNPELDYTVVAVEQRAIGGARIAALGFNPLVAVTGKAILGERLNIIQHPGGQPKQVAMRENKLIDILDQFVHYRTDTEPGSSGSPVFNDQWEVVALHHAGVPARDSESRLLTHDGSAWRPEMGDGQIKWAANEGARVSRIVADLRGREMRAEASALLERALALTNADAWSAWDSATPLAAGLGEAAGTEPLRVTVPLTIDLSAGAAPLPATGQEPPPSAPAAPAPSTAGEDPDRAAALADLDAATERPYLDQDLDAAAKDAYYATIDWDSEPGELQVSLSALLHASHREAPSYHPARWVYPWVDLRPDMSLRSIYSGAGFDPRELIELEFEQAREFRAQVGALLAGEASTDPSRLAARIEALETSHPYNCEHVVPQSWFGKAEPMRGDLHHLFTCESGCNSFRGNQAYFDFLEREEVVRDACGRREEDGFEPAEGKGAVARATLYFLLRYPGEVGEGEFEPERVETLLAWHKSEHPDEYELHRNAAVFEIQGNRNPLIDLADQPWVRDHFAVS